MTGYYDYVLGLIPAALIGITAFLNLVGLPLALAVPVGSVAATGLIAHAMFVKGPVVDARSTGQGPSRGGGAGTASGGAPRTPGASD